MVSKERMILIVDDDPDFRASTAAILQSQGYKVVAAESGKEGLAKFSSEPPDLVILDIMMEYDSAGYEVNQAIKFREEFSRHVPILMVSSIQVNPATLFSRATEVELVTPDAYLTKPLDIPQFLEQVRILLEGRPSQELTHRHVVAP
ncbi:MAG TPA: response regulator [Acidobacteriota bacterium]|nr:response regulator [Acidobacteriota bacterium]